jgi:hypothetical protein
MRRERIIDNDDKREAFEKRMSERFCFCGYPDMPGTCPGPRNCPMHGEEVVK